MSHVVLWLKLPSCVQLFLTSWTVAQQAHSMGILQVKFWGWACQAFTEQSLQTPQESKVSKGKHILYCMESHQGSPKNTEWVAYPVSQENFLNHLNRTQVSLHCSFHSSLLSYQGNPHLPSFLHLISLFDPNNFFLPTLSCFSLQYEQQISNRPRS